MGSVTTLILAFMTASGAEHLITIKNPKQDLSLSTVTAAMQAIIDSQAFLSSDDEALATVDSCYYKTVTKTALTNPGEGE